jgi:hypothetical protein
MRTRRVQAKLSSSLDTAARIGTEPIEVIMAFEEGRISIGEWT